jgi:hypothetical protein
MENFDQTMAHISCNKCSKQWQVLNEEGTDWDEEATATLYYSEKHNCNPEE